MSEIEDGKGRGFQAAVDPDQRLEVRSTSETDIQESSAFKGKAFSFSSNFIPIGITSTEVAVLFIRHNGTEEFRVQNISVHTNTGPAQWKLYRNPTNINIGTTSTAVNLNFGSTKLFDGETIIGTSAAVMTGISAGARIGEKITFGGSTTFDIAAALALGQNESVGITVLLSSTAIVGCTMLGHDIEEL